MRMDERQYGRVTITEYLISLLPIAGATLALAFQLWGWPENWDSPLHKKVAVVAVFGFLSACQYCLMYWRSTVAGRLLRQGCLENMLDALIAHAIIDPTGGLNARANVMRPSYRWAVWWDKRAPRKLRPTPKLHIVAASRNMRNAPQAGLPWARGNGCVGLLWASGAESLVADLPEGPPEQDHYRLTQTQRELTGHIKCIISMAIFRGLGKPQRFLGIINIESQDHTARNCWLEDGEPREDLVGLLRRFAIHTAEHNLVA